MKVEVFSDNPFNSTSNVIILEDNSNDCWIVDCGNPIEVISYIKQKKLFLKGIFLTHAHFDHIYGLRELAELNPFVLIYTSEYGVEMIQNSRKNMSFYWGHPFEYQLENISIIEKEGQEILLNGEYFAKAYFTPGHNPSCITWVVGDKIFTGDAYIPGIKTVTNLPGSDKLQAKESLDTILKLSEGKIIYPGHALKNDTI